MLKGSVFVGLRHLLEMWLLVSLSVGDVERVDVCGSAPLVDVFVGFPFSW